MADQVDPSLVLIETDFQSGVSTFYLSDGREMVFKDPAIQPSARLKSMYWAPYLYGALITTIDGDEVAFELPRPDSAEQLDGRTVVYLDQCIWRVLNEAQKEGPSRGHRNADLQAGRELIQLVAERKVILPLSSGHHVETARWSHPGKRYELGLTILRLSRGWQLMDPLALRRSELRAALQRHVRLVDVPPQVPAFTLVPNAAAATRVAPFAVGDDLPPEARLMTQALTYVSAMADTILDADPIPKATDKIGWVEVNQRFGDWLDRQTTWQGSQKRKAVNALLFRDIGEEIANEAWSAGLTPDQMASWVGGPMFRDLDSLPSLGIYKSILQERHLNVGTKWTVNDLTDMVYLSAAVGYADITVAERHETSMIRQAQRRLGREAAVFPSLADALPAVHEHLSRRPTSQTSDVQS